jgi:hypothetical protein
MAPFVAEMEFYGEPLRVEGHNQLSVIMMVRAHRFNHLLSAAFQAACCAFWIWVMHGHVGVHSAIDFVIALAAGSFAIRSVDRLVPELFRAYKWHGEARQQWKSYKLEKSKVTVI